MQKKRRPHGIQSRKISVSVSADDLRVLSARAKRFHGGNVSAVVHDLVETLRREEALDELVKMLGADSISEAEVRALDAELAVSKPKRRKAKRVA